MARVIGPDFVALQVRDLEKSRGFYEEILGLEAVPDSPPDAVVFDTEPVPFAIRTPLVDLDATDRLGWGVALWLNCDDADQLHERLVEADTPITQSPIDGNFGRQFSFVDPDGYPIVVHQMR